MDRVLQVTYLGTLSTVLTLGIRKLRSLLIFGLGNLCPVRKGKSVTMS